MNIADYIPMGKENAVSRAQLVNLTGLPDRKIRDCIKQANVKLAQEGKAILSSSGAKGYWISDDAEEMTRYLRESDHRARMQRLNDAPIRDYLIRLSGQRVITVREHTRRVHRSDTLEIEGQTKMEG